ncbi:unnamed protein product [Amoebophrya sp. A120]|nr:unnamed protein product [Amoebophrya sp. A120]|eukprot:GSA120T00021747001.1
MDSLQRSCSPERSARMSGSEASVGDHGRQVSPSAGRSDAPPVGPTLLSYSESRRAVARRNRLRYRATRAVFLSTAATCSSTLLLHHTATAAQPASPSDAIVVSEPMYSESSILFDKTDGFLHSDAKKMATAGDVFFYRKFQQIFQQEDKKQTKLPLSQQALCAQLADEKAIQINATTGATPADEVARETMFYLLAQQDLNDGKTKCVDREKANFPSLKALDVLLTDENASKLEQYYAIRGLSAAPKAKSKKKKYLALLKSVLAEDQRKSAAPGSALILTALAMAKDFRGKEAADIPKDLLEKANEKFFGKKFAKNKEELPEPQALFDAGNKYVEAYSVFTLMVALSDLLAAMDKGEDTVWLGGSKKAVLATLRKTFLQDTAESKKKFLTNVKHGMEKAGPAHRAFALFALKSAAASGILDLSAADVVVAKVVSSNEKSLELKASDFFGANLESVFLVEDGKETKLSSSKGSDGTLYEAKIKATAPTDKGATAKFKVGSSKTGKAATFELSYTPKATASSSTTSTTTRSSTTTSTTTTKSKTTTTTTSKKKEKAKNKPARPPTPAKKKELKRQLADNPYTAKIMALTLDVGTKKHQAETAFSLEDGKKLQADLRLDDTMSLYLDMTVSDVGTTGKSVKPQQVALLLKYLEEKSGAKRPLGLPLTQTVWLNAKQEEDQTSFELSCALSSKKCMLAYDGFYELSIIVGDKRIKNAIEEKIGTIEFVFSQPSEMTITNSKLPKQGEELRKDSSLHNALATSEFKYFAAVEPIEHMFRKPEKRPNHLLPTIFVSLVCFLFGVMCLAMVTRWNLSLLTHSKTALFFLTGLGSVVFLLWNFYFYLPLFGMVTYLVPIFVVLVFLGNAELCACKETRWRLSRAMAAGGMAGKKD